MKRLLLIITIIILSLPESTTAQELPFNYQYMLNGYFLNPALVVTNPGNVRFNGREQWIGIEGAPRTIAGSAQLRLGKNKNNGVGAYFYNDKNGNVNRFGFQASYAHRIKINQKYHLGMGISFSGFQFSLDQRNLQTYDANDPAISGGVSSVYSLPDANVGAILFSETTFVGISATQLLNTKVKLDGEIFTDNIFPVNFFFTTGYKNYISEMVQVEPSFVMKLTPNQPIEYHINTKLYFNDAFWLGGSYRVDESVMALVGFNVYEYHFGYAYQHYFGKLAAFNHGTHEFMVGFNFESNRPRRGAVKCPAFN